MTQRKIIDFLNCPSRASTEEHVSLLVAVSEFLKLHMKAPSIWFHPPDSYSVGGVVELFIDGSLMPMAANLSRRPDDAARPSKVKFPLSGRGPFMTLKINSLGGPPEHRYAAWWDVGVTHPAYRWALPHALAACERFDLTFAPYSELQTELPQFECALDPGTPPTIYQRMFSETM